MTTVSLSLIVVLSLVTVPPAAAATPPGATTLIAPIGNVVGTTIAFSWQAIPEATAYLLFIGGALTNDALNMEVWYTAEQAGCPSKSTGPPGTCTITLTPPVGAATYKWGVRTWGAGGFGPASEPSVFVIKDPVQNWGGRVPLVNVRFTRAFGVGAGQAAYVDNETGLIWAQPEQESFTGTQARFVCQDKKIFNKMGFRLPTRDELQTLVDPSNSLPSLPDGHPFDLPNTLKFWTYTREVVLSNNATFTFIVDFFDGTASTVPQGGLQQTLGVWCVRGPGGR